MVLIIIVAAVAAVVHALPGDPPGNQFMPPTRTDERSACPYLNTLANHGFINRTGAGITRSEVINAFDVAFNVDTAISDQIFTAALAGTTSNIPDTLNFVDLNQHGLIEHDGSLSRDDEATGNNFVFNQTIWNQMTMFFTTPLISIEQMATARVGRINRQRAANPVFNFNDMVAMTSLGETSLVLMTFSNGSVDGNANRQQVDTFFREERLPFDQGYTIPTQRITAQGIQEVGAKITAASGPGVTIPANGSTTATGTASPGAPAAASSCGRVPINVAAFGLTLAGFTWSLL